MAPAPTKTPSQAASSAAAARSQRRSVRATSSRRGPLPPVGTGARIAEGAGLGPGALTLAPGGGYRPFRGALLDERDHDPRLVLRAGRRGVRGRGRTRDRRVRPEARGGRGDTRRATRPRGRPCRLVPHLVGPLPARRPAGRAPRARACPRAPRGRGRAGCELPLRAARAAGRALLGGGGGPRPSARRGPPAGGGGGACPPRARAGEPAAH